MRKAERLNDFYDELKRLHMKYRPDWRFGQLLVNFFWWLDTQNNIDPFFPEEYKMLEYFKEFIVQVSL